MGTSTKNNNFHLHFILGLIFGNNLGLNSLLKLIKLFFANFFCHFWIASKTVTKVMHEEDLNFMRNTENYFEDLAV